MDNYDIAVIAMTARFPGARTVEEFWRNLCAGEEAIARFTDEELLTRGVHPSAVGAHNFVKVGAVPPDVDRFAASFFGFSPREAELMDPQHRLFLECSWEALELAGYCPDNFPGLIGVYAGTSLSTYLLFNLLEHPDIRDAQDTFPFMIGNDKDFLATRVSYHLNLRGPSMDVQTGCSTSLVALHLACEGLLSCQCDMALVGGASINVPQRTGYFYQPGGVTSPDGHCRAFDAEARGTVFGSGVGVVVLKRLEDALADGDQIHAVIKGSAVNNDGASKVGYTAPSVEGQAEVIARAQAVAGVRADTISYVEAHGTGTTLGDAVELQALTKAFRAGTDASGFCAIGSVKTNIGHLDAAAGVAGLIKTVLSLRHGQLPPSLHYERPNPEIDFASSPFHVNSELREWPAGGGPRRAGVSSFGIGGTNAHVILEEAPAPKPSDAARRWQVLPLSAKTDAELDSTVSNLAEHLRRNPRENLADVAFTLQVGRKAFGRRRVLLSSGCDEAADALASRAPDRLLGGIPWVENRSVAFLFPGQGTQRTGMARDLYENDPLFREQVDLCCDLLRPHLDLDLRSVIYPAEGVSGVGAERLEQTAFAQPALFVVEYALAQMWMGRGVRPEVMLGHSLGEYVAACVAGVFTLEEALALVAARGRLMQQTAGGAMLAVTMAEEHALSLLDHTGLSLAAVNGPLQCVLSGPVEAVTRLGLSLTARGVEHQRLATSHAFHSEMMETVMGPFARELGRFRLRPPSIPFLSNVTGTWITDEEATDPAYWARHLRQTVRFARGLDALLAEPDWVLLEVGPGQTLSALARRHPARQARQPVLASLPHAHEPLPDTAFALTTLGRLWLSGLKVDWASLHEGARRRLPLPTYPFERQRYWVEPQARNGMGGARPADPSRRAEMSDWFYTPSWNRTLLRAHNTPEPAPEQGARWLVFDDGSAFASGLVRRLERSGQTTTRVSVGARFGEAEGGYEIDPAEPRDYERLLDALAQRGHVPERVLHLWRSNPHARARSSAEDFSRGQAEGFYSLLYLAQSLNRARIPSQRIWTVAAGVNDVTGEEELAPEHATMRGLCDVLPQEFPQLACHLIDVDPPASGANGEAQLIESVMRELTHPKPAACVALRHRQRWVQSFERVRMGAVSDTCAPLRPGGVYMILGGLGAVGLSLAESLAKTCQARLVLVRRSPFPARDEWDECAGRRGERDATVEIIRRLRAVEGLGSRVLVVNADVADREQMRAAVRLTQEHFGALHGVIHAAGQAGPSAFRLIPELDRTECEAQFRSKGYGLYALADALDGHEPDFCLLFSSNASVLGGLGLAAYASASRFMDAFALNQNRLGKTPWLSVNWDAWLAPEAGATAAAPSPSAGIARYALTPEEGTEALRRVLAQGVAGQVVVSSGDLDARVNLWIERASAREDGPAGTLHPRPELESTYVAPTSDLEQSVIEIWQDLLGIEQIGVHDNFFDLGGNSLIGGKIMARVNETFRAELPVVKLFEHPTVSALVKLISNEEGPRPAYEQRHSRGERRRERRQGREVRE